MPVSLKRLGAAALAGGLVVFAGSAMAQAPAPKPAAPKPAAPKPAPPKPAAPAPAPAQPAPAPQAGGAPPPNAPVRVELQPSQPEWTKVCGPDPAQGGRKVCYTTRDFGQAPDQPPVLALLVNDPEGDDNKSVRLLLPPALLLKPGFRFSVDKGAMLEGEFEICFPNGCFAESKVKGATINAMKAGTSLNIVVRNQFNGEVTFALPLAGFGKAFDGPPVDPQVLQAQQDALRKQMEQKIEDERKKAAAGGAAPAAPGAPAAPAAPAQ